MCQLSARDWCNREEEAMVGTTMGGGIREAIASNRRRRREHLASGSRWSKVPVVEV